MHSKIEEIRKIYIEEVIIQNKGILAKLHFNRDIIRFPRRIILLPDRYDF